MVNLRDNLVSYDTRTLLETLVNERTEPILKKATEYLDKMTAIDIEL